MSTLTRTRQPPQGTVGATVAVLRFEAERRLRTTGVIAVLLAAFGGVYLWIGPQLFSDIDLDAVMDAFPPGFSELFGFETLNTLEGLLASEFYSLAWLVGLGAYLTYTAAGSVAGDLKSDRMETTLAAAISRPSVLLGKYLALLVPIVILNAVVPVVLYAGSLLVDDPLSVADLAILHVLFIPYLLCWGAIGLLLGVSIRRGRTASRVGLGLVFAAWLVESLVVGTDIAVAGRFSPMYYLNPPDVLVHGTYSLADAGILLAVALVALVIAGAVFVREDL